jgi:hypothetical protein
VPRRESHVDLLPCGPPLRRYQRSIGKPVLVDGAAGGRLDQGDAMKREGFVKMPRSLLESEAWRSLGIMRAASSTS